MKKYKYNDLSLDAQIKAIKDYIEGWEETHEKGDLDEPECHTILQGIEPDDYYTVNGEYIGEYDDEK